jgi:hypothetical protein
VTGIPRDETRRHPCEWLRVHRARARVRIPYRPSRRARLQGFGLAPCVGRVIRDGFGETVQTPVIPGDEACCLGRRATGAHRGPPDRLSSRFRGRLRVRVVGERREGRDGRGDHARGPAELPRLRKRELSRAPPLADDGRNRRRRVEAARRTAPRQHSLHRGRPVRVMRARDALRQREAHRARRAERLARPRAAPIRGGRSRSPSG